MICIVGIKRGRRSFMKKKLLLFLKLCFTQIITPIIVEHIQLPTFRTRDLVICNDSTEFYMRNEPLTLPWNLSSNLAISHDLLKALSAQQLVLCTKSLCQNIQFIAYLWHNFATQSKSFLIQKYQPLSKQSVEEFSKQVDIYQPAIQEINKLYTIINTIIATNKDHESTLSGKINNAMATFYKNDLEWLQENSQLHKNVQHLFTMYTLYQIILANAYICKEITNEYILFIPQNLIHSSYLDPQLINVTQQKNINPEDIHMGLCYTQYKDYSYQTPLTEQEAQTMANQLKKIDHLGQFLLEALNRLVIKKSLLKLSFQEYGNEILPYFNIFLTGHGSNIPEPKPGYIYSDSVTAEISIKQTPRTKTFKNISKKTGKEETKQYTYTSSDFLEILNFFNNQLFMKSLTILSCYPGGKKIQYEFDIHSKLNNLNLEKLTYPIMIIGSTLSPISSWSSVALLPPFKNINIDPSIYAQQKKYGPHQINKQAAFTRFFNFLNQTKTYEKFKVKNTKNKEVQHYRIQDPTHKLPTTETFTVPYQSFTHAANVFSNLYDESTQILKKNMLSNYVLIKFPHTSWFTPSRFKKQVIHLSQVAMITKQQLIVSADTQAILIDTNLIFAPILFPYQPLPSLIPINYLNQNYLFDIISVSMNSSLEKTLEHFFTIQTVEEPINIVINRLTIGSKSYTDVYIFIYNNFGTQGFRNGYIFTDSSNRTTLVHWPHDKPFEIQKVVEPFTTKASNNLIATVIKNAQKPNNISSPNTSSSSNSGKSLLKTDLDKTSQQLSKAKVQHLEAILTGLKAKDIAQLQKERKEKAETEPLAQRPVHETTAAKNATKWTQQHYPATTKKSSSHEFLIAALELASLINK